MDSRSSYRVWRRTAGILDSVWRFVQNVIEKLSTEKWVQTGTWVTKQTGGRAWKDSAFSFEVRQDFRGDKPPDYGLAPAIHVWNGITT